MKQRSSGRGQYALYLLAVALPTGSTHFSLLSSLQTAVSPRQPSAWSPRPPLTSITPTSHLTFSQWRCQCAWAAPGRPPVSHRAVPHAPRSAQAHRPAARAARHWAPPRTAARPARTLLRLALPHRLTSRPPGSGWPTPWCRSCSHPCQKRPAWRRRGWILLT